MEVQFDFSKQPMNDNFDYINFNGKEKTMTECPVNATIWVVANMWMETKYTKWAIHNENLTICTTFALAK